jgi:hypothetical protein
VIAEQRAEETWISPPLNVSFFAFSLIGFRSS